MVVAPLKLALVLTSMVISVGVARADFRCEPTCYPGAPQRPPCDGVHIVCEGSGNKAVLAANLIGYRLLEAMIARQGHDPKACRAAIQAAHNTRLAVAQLRDEFRRTENLGSGARYVTAQGKGFEESALLRLIDNGESNVALFRACGGDALVDEPKEAVKLLRTATQLAGTTTRAQPTRGYIRARRVVHRPARRVSAMLTAAKQTVRLNGGTASVVFAGKTSRQKSRRVSTLSTTVSPPESPKCYARVPERSTAVRSVRRSSSLW